MSPSSSAFAALGAGLSRRVAVNVEPWPGALATRMSPPMARARRREMASPSPVPPWRRRTASSACSNSENSEGSVSAAMPMPVSSTAMAISRSSLSAAGLVLADLPTVTSTPPAIGELDGVAEQVGDDLAHAHLVAQQRTRQRRIDRPGDVDAFLVGLRRQQLHHALHALVDRQGGGVEVQLVGLDLGEVEDLVDQGEQRARRALDGVGVGALLGGEVRIGQQRRHAEDAVHRRADLVAHGRQEARLGAVGGFRLLARLPQLGLRAPPLGDVAAGALHLGDGGIAGRDRMLLPLDPARPERGLRSAARSAAGAARSPAPGAQACRRPSRGG